jgi:hypothetical protein
MSTEINYTEINNKIKPVATAMSTAESGFQHQLAQYAAPSELCGASALVMMLSPVGVKAANDAVIADPSTKRPTRITFMVLRLLSPGWSTLPANAASIGDKKGAKVKLAERFGDHCLAYSYQLVKRGGYAKGLRSPEGVMISPGMVFTLNVFPSNLAKVIKVTEDMKTFDIGVVELMLKSTESAKCTEMMEIKSLLSIKGCSPSSLRIADGSIMPQSLQDAAAAKTRFGDGSYLSDVGDNVKQEWIKGNLSPTVTMMAYKVSAAGGNTFAVGADNCLRFHGNIAGLPVDAFEVIYDARQFGEATLDWVAGILNVVASMCEDAVEVLVSVDSYQGKDAASAPVNGFVRLHLGALATSWQSKDAIGFASFPSTVASTFADAKQHPSLICLPYDDWKMHLVIDTRRISRTATASSSKQPMLGVSHIEAMWRKGYNAYIFTEGRLVFQFVISADTGSTTNIAGARGLQPLAIVANVGEYDAATDSAEAAAEVATEAADGDNKRKIGAATTTTKRRRAEDA